MLKSQLRVSAFPSLSAVPASFLICYFFLGDLVKASCEQASPERKSHQELLMCSCVKNLLWKLRALKSNAADGNVQAVWKVSEVNVSLHSEPFESLLENSTQQNSRCSQVQCSAGEAGARSGETWLWPSSADCSSAACLCAHFHVFGMES